MYFGKRISGIFTQIKNDARIRESIVYKILLWIRKPRYAMMRHREVSFYSQLLGKGRCGLIFDLGASVGGKAEIFRRHGRVICVEPSAAAVKVLRMRFAHCQDIEILEAAISNNPGYGTLLEFEPGSPYNTLSDRWAWVLQEKSRNRFGLSMPQPVEKTVQLVTIDELMSQYGLPRYIKIDIEGFESLAIQGMNRRCELLSMEFNLPEFLDELTEVICRLQQIDGNALFNVTVSEPPLKLAFSDWLSGSATLERIKEANWRYIELFCKMDIKSKTTSASSAA
jgi:FkbM family methyltransferase